MSARVCSRPGCGRPVERQGYCEVCRPVQRAQAEAGRPSRQSRGYDARHDAERRRWAPRVAMGKVRCSRCGELIRKGEPWHLDHDDEDRSRYRGPSHESCNTRAPRLR